MFLATFCIIFLVFKAYHTKEVFSPGLVCPALQSQMFRDMQRALIRSAIDSLDLDKRAKYESEMKEWFPQQTKELADELMNTQSDSSKSKMTMVPHGMPKVELELTQSQQINTETVKAEFVQERESVSSELFKIFEPILALNGYKAGLPSYCVGFLNKITGETYYPTDRVYDWKKDAAVYFKLK